MRRRPASQSRQERHRGVAAVALTQHQHELEVATRGKGLYDFTAAVKAWVESTGIRAGLLTLFLRHTSASLLIQENYDPDVAADLADFFERLAPERDAPYRHTLEGPDDMPAHIRAAVTPVSLGIPVKEGRLALGPWQGVYLFEHRRGGMRRSVALHLIGES